MEEAQCFLDCDEPTAPPSSKHFRFATTTIRFPTSSVASPASIGNELRDYLLTQTECALRKVKLVQGLVEPPPDTRTWPGEVGVGEQEVELRNIDSTLPHPPVGVACRSSVVKPIPKPHSEFQITGMNSFRAFKGATVRLRSGVTRQENGRKMND